jgi:addiction module HigA family antidote
MEMYNPPHPGEVIKEMYMKPLKLTVTALAERLGVERKAVSRLINGHVGMSSEMAVRLSKVFNTSAEVWAREQLAYDLWHAKQRMKRELSKLKPFNFEEIEKHS